MPDTQAIDYQQLAGAMMSQMVTTTKALPTAPNAKYLRGPTGLFNSPGLDRQVFSALSLPNGGLSTRLPVKTTNLFNPLYGLITGIGDDSGAEADGVCDDGKQTGFLYGCNISAPLGRVVRTSMVYDVDRLGLFNRGETPDLQLVGGVSGSGQLLPAMGTNQQALQSDMRAAMFLMGVSYLRKMSALTFVGNPANNTANSGYKEFRGLDILINTSYVDVETSTACPAADSKVTTFNAIITASPSATLVAFTNMMRHLERRAVLSGLDPTTFAIVMRAEAFYELTEVWPCAYSTYRCSTGIFTTSDVRQTDSAGLIAMRDNMRNGLYLLIDGKQVEVIIDDSILQTEFVANTTYESDVYFVPLTVAGGIDVLYWETLNYTATLAQMNMGGNDYYVSDGGRFLWTTEKYNYCRKVTAKLESRMILRTPHLAGRIDGVRYTPTMILPSPIIGEDGYVNGGVQVRS